MNDSHSKEIGQFLVFCLEEYKAAESLSGESAFGLFEKNGVFDYLKEGYDQLHTLDSAALVEDIRDYLGRRHATTEQCVHDA
jgi:hypothetical protein